MVMIFRTASLMALRAVYNVEVLPLPVGPVTRMMPCGNAKTRWNDAKSRASIPNCPIPRKVAFCRNNRRTTASPCSIGITETR